MVCGQLPLGGCDLVDLAHHGPCVVDGKLTGTGRRAHGSRAAEVAAEQIAMWSEPMIVTFDDPDPRGSKPRLTKTGGRPK